MLILSRKENGAVRVGDNVKITVLEIRQDSVRLGFDADASVPIHREEVWKAIKSDSVKDADHGFREIPGWPGYRVNSIGVVQSCKDNSGFLSDEWEEKKANVDKDGYMMLRLHKKNRTLFTGVHPLVLTCFGPTRPPGPSMALHKDGVPSNNCISNLYWGFAKDNAIDRDAHGTTALGERSGNAKLTWEEVFAIRASYATGLKSMLKIAGEFSVSKKTVLNIVNRKTWVRGEPSAKPLIHRSEVWDLVQREKLDRKEGA